MKLKQKIVIPLLLSSVPVHELGHWLFARYFGAGVVMIWFNFVVVDETVFSTLQYIIFKLGGFLITFVPALIFTIPLKDTPYCRYPVLWLIASPGLAAHDFYDIGLMISGQFLARSLSFLAYALTGVGCLVTFWRDIHEPK